MVTMNTMGVQGNSVYTRKSQNSPEMNQEQSDKIRQMQRMLRGEDKKPSYTNPILESMQRYSESLKTQRNQAKNTALGQKKLQYQFKNLSSKILRSKTSNAARQAANQAKREVTRLKRLRQSGEYDNEEIDAAISHAKAMERIAKKKVKHLTEEELHKSTGGVCMDNEVDDKQDMKESAARIERFTSSMDQFLTNAEQVSREFAESFAEDLKENLRDLLEDMGLSDLLEAPTVDREIDPADYDAMVRKHRNREMKEMVRADAEYLKAVFDRLERLKSGGGVPGMGGGMGATAGAGVVTPGDSMGAMAFPMPVPMDSPESTINIML